MKKNIINEEKVLYYMLKQDKEWGEMPLEEVKELTKAFNEALKEQAKQIFGIVRDGNDKQRMWMKEYKYLGKEEIIKKFYETLELIEREIKEFA